MLIFCFRKGPRTEWDRHRGRPEKPGVEEGEASASCGELLGVGQVAGNRLQEWRRGTILGQRWQVQSGQPHRWFPWGEAVGRQTVSQCKLKQAET